MARFNFTLQTVLSERERQEQLAQRELAEKIRFYDSIEQKLRTCETEIVEAQQQMRDHQSKGRIDPQFLIAHRRYMAAVRVRVQGIAQDMAGARLAIETARRVLTSAVTQRKSIEILRDRQLAAFRADQNRKDRILSDEIGAQLAIGNLSGI